jgi:glycosyltransferase involved in cell wall biosynthesis
MPRVSVIMPSYNHEKFIYDSIKSVLKQSFQDFELIIIDDASVDNSKDIINFFKQKDPRIKVKFHQKNLGIEKTINEALNISKGDFIAFTASDDIWLPCKLENQLSVINENNDLIVWSDGQIINENNELIGKTFLERLGALKRKKSGDLFQDLLEGNYIFGTTIMVKSDNIKDIKFDGRFKYLNDYKFIIHLAERFKFHFISENQAYYRLHGNNTVITEKRECNFEDILIREYFLKKYGKNIHKKTKWSIYNQLRMLYSDFEDKKKSKYYLKEALYLDPIATLRYISIEVTFNVLKRSKI